MILSRLLGGEERDCAELIGVGASEGIPDWGGGFGLDNVKQFFFMVGLVNVVVRRCVHLCNGRGKEGERTY